MSFIIDKQTLEDLGIFSRNKKTSIFAIYDSTRTRGGSRMLEEMFANPLDNVGLISRRSSVARCTSSSVPSPRGCCRRRSCPCHSPHHRC